MKSVFFIILLILAGCGRSQSVILIKETPTSQLRFYREYSGCCGCQSIRIDRQLTKNDEINYWLHCNCANGVRKSVRVLENGKVKTNTIYESVTELDSVSIPLDINDSLLLFKLQKVTNFNFDKCNKLTDSLLLIKGFKMKEIEYPKGMKSPFRRKAKI